jgi:uncharacterized protein (TIGR03382 family)
VPVVVAEASASVPLTGLMGEAETDESDTTTSDTGETQGESGDDEVGESDLGLDEGAESGCSCTSNSSAPSLGLLGLWIILWPLRRRSK